MKIDFYKELINKLNPLDESEFMYNTKTWNKLNSELKNNLTIFEDKSISRSMVVDSFKSYFNGNTDFSLPFVLTMIWGFADTGYGTYRTNNYYESNENQNFMKNAFKYVSQCEIEKAYKELQK